MNGGPWSLEAREGVPVESYVALVAARGPPGQGGWQMGRGARRFGRISVAVVRAAAVGANSIAGKIRLERCELIRVRSASGRQLEHVAREVTALNTAALG